MIILVISRFGFEGWMWVLIASVPDLCIHFYLFYHKFLLKKDLCLQFSAMYYTSLILIKVLYSSTQFSKCPVSFPIVSVVKLAKEIWVLLGKLAHI